MNAVLEMDAGVAGYSGNAGPTQFDQVKDASAVRWLFNPAARIDVRDRVVGYEPGPDGRPAARRFIRAGVLTPIRNVTYNVPPRNAHIPGPALGNPQARTQRLVAQTKYAVEVAEELTFAYAETGLVVIDALTGVEDDAAVSGIVRMLFGGKIQVVKDSMLPGEQVPVIPSMMESLVAASARIAEAFSKNPDPTLQARVESARAALLNSCRLGLGWARSLTDESRRLLKSRTPGGGSAKIEYDDRDRRAFAALGESVPQEQGVATQDVSSEQLLRMLTEAQIARERAVSAEAALKQDGITQSEADELRETVKRLTATVEQMQAQKAPRAPKVPKVEE